MCAVERNDRFDDTELSLIRQALNTNDLWPYVYGNDDRRHFMGDAISMLEQYFRAPVSRELPYIIPTSSGTASIHVALGGLQIPAGSEVIVSPITDIGTVMPIIFQNAIPVFADVEPDTGNISAATIERLLTERTAAVIVAHLTGSPVDITKIMDLCRPRCIKVIEDAAQALGAIHNGHRVGTLGDAGCFSLNSQKHITAGEGGFVIVKDEDQFYRCHNFSDKHRDRFYTDVDEHDRYAGVGLNYRMSELQGAMILGQLHKLESIASRRHAFGISLDDHLRAVDGIVPQVHLPQSRPSFFFHMFRIDKALDSSTKRKIVNELNKGIGKSLSMRIGGSYGLPIYKYPVFRNKNFFDGNADDTLQIWPAEIVAKSIYNNLPAKYMDYSAVYLPNAEEYIDNSFSVWLDERHTVEHARLLSMEIIETLRRHYAIP